MLAVAQGSGHGNLAVEDMLHEQPVVKEQEISIRSPATHDYNQIRAVRGVFGILRANGLGNAPDRVCALDATGVRVHLQCRVFLGADSILEVLEHLRLATADQGDAPHLGWQPQVFQS